MTETLYRSATDGVFIHGVWSIFTFNLLIILSEYEYELNLPWRISPIYLSILYSYRATQKHANATNTNLAQNILLSTEKYLSLTVWYSLIMSKYPIRCHSVSLTWTPDCGCGWQCWTPGSSGGAESHWSWAWLAGPHWGPHWGPDWGESWGRGRRLTPGTCGQTLRVRQSRRRSGLHGGCAGGEFM